MLKIIKSEKVMPMEEIMKEYKGYVALVIAKETYTGSVYAYSDFDDLPKLTDIQFKLEDDMGWDTFTVSNFGQNNHTLYAE